MFDYLDKLFDFNGDGKLDLTEEALKYGYIQDEILADNDDDDTDNDDDDDFADFDEDEQYYEEHN